MCLLLFEGFACFKCFFENVNQNENKLKKTSNIMVTFVLRIVNSVVSVFQCVYHKWHRTQTAVS